jgi:hypothetical protein
MAKIAFALDYDSNIYEIDLSAHTPQVIFDTITYPVVVAWLGNGSFAYIDSNGFKNILREDPPYEWYPTGPDKVIYTHPTWIRDIKIRYKAVRYNFFFSAYHTDTSVRIFYLDEMDNPVPYCTIEGSQLKVIDPCHPEGETYFGTWGGNFTFDDKDNMYISSGNNVSSGLFKIGGAGTEEVTGEIERIVTSPNEPITSIEFIGNNQLLYVQGKQKIYKLDLQTLTSTLVYDVAQFSSHALGSLSLMKEDAKFDLHKKKKFDMFNKKSVFDVG